MLLPREEQDIRHRMRGWRDRLREAEEGNWESLRTLGDQPRHHLSPSTTYILRMP